MNNDYTSLIVFFRGKYHCAHVYTSHCVVSTFSGLLTH